MSDMTKAYKLAALAVRQRYAEQHPEYLEVLDGLTKRDVAVYTGTYDSVQHVLEPLGVPFTTNPAVTRTAARVHFANCPCNSQPALVKNVERLVRDGAWLVSSDWALESVVQAAFPDTVRRGQGVTGDEVVGVEPWLSSLWSDVVVPGTDPQWWLEGSSYPIEVVDPAKVRVEAVSHEMLVKYKQPAVAVRFEWGAGQVFHVVSHFYLKLTRAAKDRHAGPGADFLREGLKLSEDGVAHVLREAGLRPDELNFATVQSAATSAELVAQLCVQSATAPVCG